MKKWMLICLALLLCCAARAENACVEAVIRGKTMILRMSESWVQTQLQDAAPHQGWFGDTGMHWRWSGRAAQAMLEEIAGAGAPENGSAHKPECMQSHDFEMQLSRHGDSWYSILRLRDGVQGEKELLYELCMLDYTLDESVLQAQESGCVTARLILNPARMDDCRIRTLRDENGVRIDVIDDPFGAGSPAAAVITETNADRDLLENVQLVIGESYLAPMRGYMDGKNAVFCCMLDADSLAALQGGAQAHLHRPNPAQDADFAGSPYAAARKGSGNWGVVDLFGQWVVQPEYRYISRPQPPQGNWDTPLPFFCETDQDLTVIHGETLQVIARLKNADWNGANPSVFTAYTAGGTGVYSLRTGEKLFSTDGRVVEFGSNPPREYVKLQYICRVEGYPQRLVIQRGATGSGAEKSRLADNSGNIISGEWDAILPLMWIGERGVFLAQMGGACALDAASIDFWDDYIYTNAGDPAWRCGLIDENGNSIAPCEYTGVRIQSREEIQLRNARGEWIPFLWLR